MTTASDLREIVGQETEPPLWIYVTKSQVPVLERAADELDRAQDERERAFIAGTLFGAFSMQGRHKEGELYTLLPWHFVLVFAGEIEGS